MAAVERWDDGRLDSLAQTVQNHLLQSAVEHQQMAAQTDRLREKFDSMDGKVDVLYQSIEAMRHGLAVSEQRREAQNQEAIEREKDRRAENRRALIAAATPTIGILVTILAAVLLGVKA